MVTNIAYQIFIYHYSDPSHTSPGQHDLSTIRLLKKASCLVQNTQRIKCDFYFAPKFRCLAFMNLPICPYIGSRPYKTVLFNSWLKILFGFRSDAPVENLLAHWLLISSQSGSFHLAVTITAFVSAWSASFNEFVDINCLAPACCGWGETLQMFAIRIASPFAMQMSAF